MRHLETRNVNIRYGRSKTVCRPSLRPLRAVYVLVVDSECEPTAKCVLWGLPSPPPGECCPFLQSSAPPVPPTRVGEDRQCGNAQVRGADEWHATVLRKWWQCAQVVLECGNHSARCAAPVCQRVHVGRVERRINGEETQVALKDHPNDGNKRKSLQRAVSQNRRRLLLITFTARCLKAFRTAPPGEV